MRYTPSGSVQDPQVAAELLQISRAIEDLNARIYPKLYAEPTKPQDGMVVFADGTEWDPGSGEGLYRYDLSSDEWISLEVSSSSENGFDNQTDSTMAFDDTTREFTISPAVTSFTYVSNSTEYTVTATDDTTITDTEGLHFIYYNGASLLSTTTFTEALITTYTLVAVIYWDATNNEVVYFGDERHGNIMDSQTHLYNHNTSGTRFGTGFSLDNMDTDGSGNDATAAQFGVGGGELWDEDIHVTVVAGSPQTLAVPAEIPILYRLGANGDWRKIAATTYPITTTGTGRPAWNELTGGAWQLTEVSSNNYILMHYFASPDVLEPIFAIVGQAEYVTVALARAAATVELAALKLGQLTLLSPEYIAIATVIFQTNVSYTNAVKARIRVTDEGDDYIDWRFSTSGSTGGASGTPGADGADGADGSAAIFVNQYQRAASLPSTPGATSASYNFDTTTFTPTSGWSIGVPAQDGNPVYVSTAQFYSADATGTDSSTTWTAPQILAEDGTDGVDGADGADGSDGTASRTVSLIAGQQAFSYLTDNTLNDNANTTITATVLNAVGTPYYEFFLNDVSQQDTTSNTYTYTPQAAYGNMPDKVEVHITEDGTGGTIYARDQITIYGLKAGVDAPLVIQTNEAHTIPRTNVGVHDYAGSGNTIEVYLGDTQLPYDDTVTYASPSFRVTNVAGSGISPDASPTENANDITYGNASNMTANTASITYTIVVKNTEGLETTVTRVQSFSRSNQGADGADGEDGVDGIDGIAGENAEDSTAINYTNNSHVVPITNLGVETWTGSGGLFYAYEGATNLTLDNNSQIAGYPGTPSRFRLNIVKISGDTLTEPTISGAGTSTATLTDWAGNLTTVTVYRISCYILTSNSVQVLMSTDVTLSPGVQGADGGDGTDGADGADGATGDPGADGDDSLAINYTNNAHVVPVTNTGDETWTGSGGKFYVFEGPTLLTLKTNAQTASYSGLTNGTYNLSIVKVTGDTLTEPTISGATTTAAILTDWAGDLTTATVYTVSAYIQDSKGNQVLIEEYITLAPANQGADGADGGTGSSTSISITNKTVDSDPGGGANGNAEYQLTPTLGQAQFRTDGTSAFTTHETYLLIGSPGDYEVQCITGGTDAADVTGPTGSGTWSALSSARTWGLLDTSLVGGSKTATLSLTIRHAITEVTQDTATITLIANRSV